MDRLANTIRPYAWGSATAIPHLLGLEPTGEPQAEMWMGAHPGAPSGTPRGALDAVIAADPERELGPRATAKFGPRLPFLLKLLAAGAPLSLQVHPDRAQAERGYADEERRGVPVDAPQRNYKDANHKPELICALTPFDGLCGFREPAAAAGVLARLEVDSLKPYVDLLRARPEKAALQEVLTALLTADPKEMASTVTEAAAASAVLGAQGEETGAPWGAQYAAYATLVHHYPGDPGVVAAMLLNHVRLEPGEALYLGAGVPHAYLQGLGVEIMANSDNVLRCGLTPKHVDVTELLRIVRFEASDAGVLRPAAGEDGEQVYETPIDEFRLSRYVLAPDVPGEPQSGAASHALPMASHDPTAPSRDLTAATRDLTAPSRDLTAATPQILLCTAGEVYTGDVRLGPGESVFVPAGEPVRVRGDGTLFRATVVA